VPPRRVPVAPREPTAGFALISRTGAPEPPRAAEGPIELPSDVRNRIDDMLAHLGTAQPADLLGMQPGPGCDEKELRRAYFKLSKEFHPDRYFGRQLGPYKARLQLVFTALTEAYDALSQGRRQPAPPANLS